VPNGCALRLAVGRLARQQREALLCCLEVGGVLYAFFRRGTRSTRLSTGRPPRSSSASVCRAHSRASALRWKVRDSGGEPLGRTCAFHKGPRRRMLATSVLPLSTL